MPVRTPAGSCSTCSSSPPTVATIPPSSRRTRSTVVPVLTSMPSSSSAAVSCSVASGSDLGESRSAPCTIVTFEPKREKICASSRPTGPPPTTSIDSGSSVSSSAETWSSQPVSSSPSIGGTAVRDPVATRTRSAFSCVPFTWIVCGSTNEPVPSKVAWPAPCSRSIQVSAETISESFRAFTFARLVRAGPTSMPSGSASVSMSWASSAATRYAFVGLQATLGQLPPQRVFSISATRASCSFAALLAPSRAPDPEPRTIRSNCSLIASLRGRFGAWTSSRSSGSRCS